MNKNSNTYIIIYSTVMVVVVAALLAVASLSLEARQNANMLNEKKQAILASLAAADKNYDEFIEASVVDAEGNEIKDDNGNKLDDKVVFALLNDLTGSFKEGKFPVFVAADGRVVVPVTGNGLWGPIWGYVALESDMNTVAGVVFDHSGETPGLGAEIATAKFQAKFSNPDDPKRIFEGDRFVSIKLMKGGATQANISHEVDAISGGTKTSEGVTNMLETSLGHYLNFFAKRKAAAAPAAETAENELSNDQNTESNE